MIREEQVVVLVDGIDRSALALWCRREWVRPARDEGGWLFSEADVARVRLIAELRGELAIDEEAMPVVLSLLDRVYTLRHRLRCLAEAVAEQPEPVRRAIRERLAREAE